MEFNKLNSLIECPEAFKTRDTGAMIMTDKHEEYFDAIKIQEALMGDQYSRDNE